MDYQVFLRNEYVRDAQGYLRMQLPQTDDKDIFDDKQEDGWSDVCGDMLLMELHNAMYPEVLNRIQTLYPDADMNVFRISSVSQIQEDIPPTKRTQVAILDLQKQKEWKYDWMLVVHSVRDNQDLTNVQNIAYRNPHGEYIMFNGTAEDAYHYASQYCKKNGLCLIGYDTMQENDANEHWVPPYVHISKRKCQSIKKGDKFYVRINGKMIQETASNHATWNPDADEPDWEVPAESGVTYNWNCIYFKTSK